MKQIIEEIFSKEMTRAEFLRHVGGALLMVVGFSTLLNALKSPEKQITSASQYSAGNYGGTSFKA